MRTFEESLKRVLDPEGLYWRYPGDEQDDPDRARLIELRIDVPPNATSRAVAQMSSCGWTLSSSPDGEDDEVCRLYFRRTQTVTPAAKCKMLTEGLQMAHDCDGKLMTWINVEDLEE